MSLYIEIYYKDGKVFVYDDIGAFETYNDTTWLYPIGKHLEEAIRIETKIISEIYIYAGRNEE